MIASVCLGRPPADNASALKSVHRSFSQSNRRSNSRVGRPSYVPIAGSGNFSGQNHRVISENFFVHEVTSTSATSQISVGAEVGRPAVEGAEMDEVCELLCELRPEFLTARNCGGGIVLSNLLLLAQFLSVKFSWRRSLQFAANSARRREHLRAQATLHSLLRRLSPTHSRTQAATRADARKLRTSRHVRFGAFRQLFDV